MTGLLKVITNFCSFFPVITPSLDGDIVGGFPPSASDGLWYATLGFDVYLQNYKYYPDRNSCGLIA